MRVGFSTKLTVPVYVEVDLESEKVTTVRYAWDEMEIGNLALEVADSAPSLEELEKAIQIGHTRPWPAGVES